jgi:hypothetical protein
MADAVPDRNSYQYHVLTSENIGKFLKDNKNAIRLNKRKSAKAKGLKQKTFFTLNDVIDLGLIPQWIVPKSKSKSKSKSKHKSKHKSSSSSSSSSTNKLDTCVPYESIYPVKDCYQLLYVTCLDTIVGWIYFSVTYGKTGNPHVYVYQRQSWGQLPGLFDVVGNCMRLNKADGRATALKGLSVGRILWCYLLQYLRDHLFIGHSGDIIILNDTLEEARPYHTNNGMRELTDDIIMKYKIIISKEDEEEEEGEKEEKTSMYYILNSYQKHNALLPYNESFYSGFTHEGGYINCYIIRNKIQWLDCESIEAMGAILYKKFISIGTLFDEEEAATKKSRRKKSRRKKSRRKKSRKKKSRRKKSKK